MDPSHTKRTRLGANPPKKVVDIPSTKQLWLRKSNKATDKYFLIFMMVWRRKEEGGGKEEEELRGRRKSRKRKKKKKWKWEERQRRNSPVTGSEYHV